MITVVSHGRTLEPERLVDAQAEPISVDEAKSHLRWSTDDQTQDADISRWLKTARHKLERDTGVVLLTSTWRVPVAQLPTVGTSLYLPVWPVQAITSFTAIDSTGAETNLIESPDVFIVASASRPAEIGLTDLGAWPTSVRTFQPATVIVTAGWTKPSDIPADLTMAILKLVGDFAGFRESAMAIPGQVVQRAPMSYADLIAPWTVPVLA